MEGREGRREGTRGEKITSDTDFQMPAPQALNRGEGGKEIERGREQRNLCWPVILKRQHLKD